MRYLAISSVLVFSTLLSGCFMKSHPKASLEHLNILETQMPKVCSLIKVPKSKAQRPCKSGPRANPYYTGTDPEYISCIKNLIQNISEKKVAIPQEFEMDQLFYQTFREKSQGIVGGFVFRLKNASDTKNLQTWVSKQNKTQGHTLFAKGKVLAYLFSEAKEKSVCAPEFKKQLLKQLSQSHKE